MEQWYIQSFAALNKTGMYSSAKGHVPWMEDQSGNPLDVQRKQVYDNQFTGFGKLNAPDKLAFSAAALIFSDFSGFDGEKTGISLGNTFGCLSTDLRYAESVVNGFPSPAYFAATLPSSPVADIAIIFKLKGPDRTVVNTVIPGFLALDNAMQILFFKKAESMIAILVNGIERKDIDSPFVTSAENECNFCYAFMVTPNQRTKGLNYRISLDINTNANKDSQNRSEESYFFEMINAMMQNKNYSSVFEINGIGGSITLKKDD